MTEALFLTSDELTDLAEPEDYVESVREGTDSTGRALPRNPERSSPTPSRRGCSRDIWPSSPIRA